MVRHGGVWWGLVVVVGVGLGLICLLCTTDEVIRLCTSGAAKQHNTLNVVLQEID